VSEAESGQALPSDAELIAAIRAGDMAAYGELYRRHVSAAQALARQLVRGPAEVDDVVADTFSRVLDLIRRGGGPRDAFRPYLLTAVRRGAYDRYRGERRSVVTDEIEAYDPGQPFIDPAVAGLERSLIARAFLSLPERWRTVLWHTEIEGAKPADVAPLLGLTANGVAALAYRAREGLRQAYLQMHLSGVARQECRPVAAKLGAYVRGGLSARESQAVADHLDQCADCRAVYAELADVNVALRGVVAPIFLGPLAAAYLAGLPAKGGGALAWLAAKAGWIARAPKGQQAAMAGGAAAAAGLAVVLVLALSGHGMPVHARHHRAVSAPAPPSALPGATPAPHRHARPAPPSPRAPVQVHVSSAKPPRRPRPARPAPALPPPPPSPPPLTAHVAPVGVLLRGSVGVLVFSVTDTGRHAVPALSARVVLPPGVSYVSGGSLGMAAPAAAAAAGGWSCGVTAAGAACTHGTLAPGATTTTYLQVAVAPSAGYGVPVTVSVRSGGQTVTARSGSGVVPSGLPARFAAVGRLDTIVAGNTLPQCPWWSPGWQPPSSQARVAVPGNVLWAGLYWSGTGSPSRPRLDVRGPSGGYQSVGASTVSTAGQYGEPVYQAYANVTGMVRGYGGGVWHAQIPQAQGPQARPEAETASGWVLVVVARDPSAPAGEAVVLDGAHVVSAVDPSFSVPLNGLLPAGAVAGIQAVTWNGYEGGGQPALTSARRTLTAGPSVRFSGAAPPYLVGVVAATTSADGTQAGPPPGEWLDGDGCTLLGHRPAPENGHRTGRAGDAASRGRRHAAGPGSQPGQDAPLPGRVEPGPCPLCQLGHWLGLSGGVVDQPAPGVVHGVGQPPVPEAGQPGPLARGLPGAGELGNVRGPHGQLGPGLNARGEQRVIGRPDQLGGHAGAGPGRRDAGVQQLAERAAARAGNVHCAGDPAADAVQHPARQVAGIGQPDRPAGLAGGQHAPPACHSGQPPRQPAHVVVRSSENTGTHDQVPAAEGGGDRPLAARLQRAVP
jgi:RNA polymerase sigma factor (sigma-70 family)